MKDHYQSDDIDQIVDEIISELPFKEKASMANMKCDSKDFNNSKIKWELYERVQNV